MISGVFVDRPRLAIVIAIIITMAGALAMLRIPVAQFPDIVPPQVSVQATYPGGQTGSDASTSRLPFSRSSCKVSAAEGTGRLNLWRQGKSSR